jgi:hypothetical protein
MSSIGNAGDVPLFDPNTGGLVIKVTQFCARRQQAGHCLHMGGWIYVCMFCWLSEAEMLSAQMQRLLLVAGRQDTRPSVSVSSQQPYWHATVRLALTPVLSYMLLIFLPPLLPSRLLMLLLLLLLLLVCRCRQIRRR